VADAVRTADEGPAAGRAGGRDRGPRHRVPHPVRGVLERASTDRVALGGTC